MFEFLIPYHPKVVHFPIALFVVALGFEFLEVIFRKKEFHVTAICVFVAATLAGPLAVMTGLWEAERLQLSHSLLNQHQFVGFALMWFALLSLPVLWFFKKKQTRFFRFVFLVVLLTTAGMVSYVGHLGGQMVYQYGAGVEF